MLLDAVFRPSMTIETLSLCVSPTKGVFGDEPFREFASPIGGAKGDDLFFPLFVAIGVDDSTGKLEISRDEEVATDTT